MKSVLYLVLFTLGLSQLAFAAPNCPNRPAGATTVLDTPFNTTDGEGQLWDLYPGAGKILQPGGNPASGPNASASILSPGQSTGGQQVIWPKPGNQQPLNNLYMCMVWKINSNFIGLRTGNKVFFIAAQDFTYGRQGMNGVFNINRRSAEYPYQHFQFMFGHNSGNLDNSHACSFDLGLGCLPNVSDTDIVPDRWYTIEAYVVASSCTTCRNGTVKWWIDGKLQGNYTNLNYGDGIVNQWQINHTWDGSTDKQCGPPTNPSNPIGRDCRNEQIHYFDHVTLASVGGLTPPPASPGPAPAPAPAPVPAPAPMPVPVPVPSVGTVSDLAVVVSTSNSVNLSFTEVGDGSGAPAKYDLRVGPPGSQWGSMNSISAGNCATPIAGSQVGAKKTCTISGLLPSTQYQFQIVAFSGVMNQGASYGGLSSAVNATTQAGSSNPVPAPIPAPVPAPIPGPSDSVGPQTSFVYPIDGANLRGSVLFLAQASDNVGVTELRFYINGVQLGPELKQSPYAMVADTTKIQDGNHELSIVAKDAAGNASAPSKIRINVSNAGVPAGSNPVIDVAGCMQTKTNQINASMGLIWLLPVIGLVRRRPKNKV